MRLGPLLLLISINAIGQNIGSNNTQSLIAGTNTLNVLNTGIGKSYYARLNEPPRALEFNDRSVSTSYFLANVNHYLNIPAEFTFVEVESNTDNIGMQHHLLQQYYNGIPLEGLAYRVHEKNGFVRSANGRAIRNIKADTKITITENQAFNLAVKYLNTKDSVFRTGKKLIVSKDFTFTPESFFIAYQFDIDVSFIERWRVSIDAGSGQLINKVSLVNNCMSDKQPFNPPAYHYGTATGKTNYYGNQTIRVDFDWGQFSYLMGQTEHGGNLSVYDYQHVPVGLFFFGGAAPLMYSIDNTYSTPYYQPAVSVQWSTEKVYEYYFTRHNRRSFNNQDGAIKSYVHVDVNYDNAFWTGRALAFGDGSNNNPLVELDVVGHEFTHGVTQYEAGLSYYNEPGALNESFSDILGKAIEFDTFGDTATWQVAKHFRPGGLRDLSNPNLQQQPDTYAGDLWYYGKGDYGGVHYNSGVQNFWFYLLCEGGSGINDHQAAYDVKPIGMDTAVNITYRNLTEYLIPSSDYLDSRIGSLLATADLYGNNSTAYQQVEKAWDAVGVIFEPIITSLEIYDITATTVKIKGNLLPRASQATYHFEYGTTAAYGTTSPEVVYKDKVEATLTGLQSATKYYIRLVATNEHGTTFFTSTFTTISLAPLVKLKPTVDVTETMANLYGEINPNSLFTSFYFEYGTTPAMGMATATYPLSDTTEYMNVAAAIDHLAPRQTYYYRLVATNSFASAITNSQTIFTASRPVINTFSPTMAAPGTEVTITGENFNVVPENNQVSFGATRAIVLSSTSSAIKVKVPDGASVGPITLLDLESTLMAESVEEFVPTFTGVFNRGSLQLRTRIDNLTWSSTFVADMDGDGKPDIITATNDGFSILQNVNAGGDIVNESFVRNAYQVNNTGGFEVVDFDGNGLKDVLIGIYPGGFRIYPNFSVPGYIFLGMPVDVPAGYVFSLAAHDFDGDGHIDVAAITDLPGDSVMFTVYRNQNGKGTFNGNNFEPHNLMILPYYAYRLNYDDLNNDGKGDLIVNVMEQNFVPILKNKSTVGSFAFEELKIEDSLANGWPFYVSQDLNQDGRKDVVHFSLRGGIMENQSNVDDIILGNPISIGEHDGVSVDAADIDGDGKVDLAVGSSGGFVLFKNGTNAGDHFSNASFERIALYGSDYGQNNAPKAVVIVNDLNGDGRPEIISRINNTAEIWQNSPDTCNLDATGIRIQVTNLTANIILPPNTTLDQFKIEYQSIISYDWQPVTTTTLSLLPARNYTFRARAKCYLGFGEYYTIKFTTDCVDMSTFKIYDISTSTAWLTATNFCTFEVQYSLAGKEEWKTLSGCSSYISNLLPGTTYDVRFRGKCSTPMEFQYRQFTTLCPRLSDLWIAEVTYNTATIKWSSIGGEAILEYRRGGGDTWTSIDKTNTMFPLTPGTKYYVRGRFACSNAQSDYVTISFITPCPNVSALSIDSIMPFSAHVSWTDESNTGSYLLNYSRPGGNEKTVTTNSTFLDLNELLAGARYNVAVAAQCAGEKIFATNSFTTLCYVPAGLSVDDVTYTTATLSWVDDFNGGPYVFEYALIGSDTWQSIQTSATKVSLNGLTPGNGYQARVRINCVNEVPPHALLQFTTAFYNETVYAPNPTDNLIIIYPAKNLIGKSYSIIDDTGREVLAAKLLEYSIDFSNFPAGIYMLKIDGEKLIRIMKH